MKVLGSRRFLGPSLFSSRSATVVSLQLSPGERAQLEGYDIEAADALSGLWPNLFTECPSDKPVSGNRVLLLEAVALISFAALKGWDSEVQPPDIQTGPCGGIYHLVYSATAHRLIAAAFNTALRMVATAYPAAVTPIIPSHLRTPDPRSLWQQLQSRCRTLVRQRTSQEIISHLATTDIQWLPLDDYPATTSLLQIGFGRFQRKLSSTVAFETSSQGVALSTTKLGSTHFLADMGFPVTRQLIVSSVHKAQAAAASLGYPVVLKKERGSLGDSVYANLGDAGEVAVAFTRLMEDPSHNKYRNNRIFVEDYIAGNDYRISLVNGRIVNTLQRIPAMVRGDGVSTVSQLVELANRDPRRGDKEDASSGLVKLVLNKPELMMLAKQDLSPDSVPEDGVAVLLRSNANWSTGGTLKTVTDDVHPDNMELAIRVAEALCLDIVGVDVIAEDIATSYLEGGLRIIEVNHSPGIFGYWEDDGRYVDQAEEIVEAFAPEAIKSAVPIVTALGVDSLVKGSARLSRLFAAAGYVPGLVTSQGFFVASSQWSRAGDIDRKDPAFAVLRNPEIDLAFVERSWEEILAHGVGVGGCDIGIIGPVDQRLYRSALWPAGIPSHRAAALLASVARRRILVVDALWHRLGYLNGVARDRILLVGPAAEEAEAATLIDEGALAVLASRDGDETAVSVLAASGVVQKVVIATTAAERVDAVELQLMAAMTISLGRPLADVAAVL